MRREITTPGGTDARPRLRFAPSPTGPLHAGNARTALFAWLWARRLGGDFILRLEDTDRGRSDPGAERALLDDLRWLGIGWDEGPDVGGPRGPYRQSERGALYARELEALAARGLAYPCFCTAEDLARRRAEALGRGEPPRYDGRCRDLPREEARRRLAAGEPHVWRLRIPAGPPVEFDDLVYGPHAVSRDVLDDFVLVRSDGTPTFLYANALDDALMGITHVMRGVDHLDNTPRQILLFDAWGAARPRYAHLPLVHGSGSGPLAKREGTGSLSEMRARGLRPEALRALLLHLGHHPAGEEDLLGPAGSLPFDPSRLGRAAARFDEAQLRLWQERALRALDAAAARAWLGEILGRSPDDPELLRRVPALRSAGPWAEDVRAWWRILDDPPRPPAGLLTAEDARAVLTPALGLAGEEDFAAVARALARTSGRRGRALFLPLRLALTGTPEGPELAALWAALPPPRREALLARALEATADA